MIRPPPNSTLFPSPPLSRPRPDRQRGYASTAIIRNHRDLAGAVQGDVTRPAAARRLLVEQSELTGRGVNGRSEEHTSELQSRQYLVCRLLLEKKKKIC